MTRKLKRINRRTDGRIIRVGELFLMTCQPFAANPNKEKGARDLGTLRRKPKPMVTLRGLTSL